MGDTWEPTGGEAPPPASGWPPPGSPDGPPPRPEFMRPAYLVALGVVAAMILVVGLVVALSGGDDSVSIDPGTTLAPPSTPALTTTPPVMPSTTTRPSTTSTTSTTTTSTTTTSSTTPPLAAVADAGDDRAVSADVDVDLAALDLSEENQSVVWRQTAGPDVTDGRGRMLGAEVTFRSPGRPATLWFELTVTGRGGDVARDQLRVDVLQDAGEALFVDAAAGSDAGDGSREQPFRTLERALGAARGGVDVYLRSVDGVYDLGDQVVSGGTSIFGGYDAEWVRDVAVRATVTGPRGVRVEGGDVTILSALEVIGADGDGTVAAVRAIGTDRLIVELSRIDAGTSSDGHSVGLSVDGGDDVIVVESVIRSGRAGDGADGVPATGTGERAPAGADAVARIGGDGGADGGRGGDGGSGPTAGEDGEPGDEGGRGGAPGEHGDQGAGGRGGDGGVGGAGGIGAVSQSPPDPTGAPGAEGAPGGQGLGGAGGGGGGGLVAHDGGGGGGGGGGGLGGAGGSGGSGGSGSIGAWIVDVDRVVIRDSTIEGGVAGDGGDGGAGATGNAGGAGGGGAEGVSSFLDVAGSGGGGGGGGAGGAGGHGGGGAGGASVGLLTSGVGEVEVVGSRIVAGTGGAGSGGGPGGAPGTDGTDGADGAELAGGGGGVGPAPDGAPAAQGDPASGGDAIGWWDDGATRSIDDSVVVGGTAGAPEGSAVSTRF